MDIANDFLSFWYGSYALCEYHNYTALLQAQTCTAISQPPAHHKPNYHYYSHDFSRQQTFIIFHNSSNNDILSHGIILLLSVLGIHIFSSPSYFYTNPDSQSISHNGL